MCIGSKGCATARSTFLRPHSCSGKLDPVKRQPHCLIGYLPQLRSQSSAEKACRERRAGTGWISMLAFAPARVVRTRNDNERKDAEGNS